MAANSGWSEWPVKFLAQVQSGDRAGRQFQINLSSRYRAGMTHYRIWLISGCIGLLLSIVWSLWQGVLIYEESQIIEAELERVRQLDNMVMAEAKKEGIDLSEGALQRLSSEV
ncbi:MAG TPA: hypothetical protein PLO50_11835, partial [Nitrospira sp.]|nr:hypothetical protein [Nitrospira sp.]